jgi:four helix bundle protein
LAKDVERSSAEVSGLRFEIRIEELQNEDPNRPKISPFINWQYKLAMDIFELMRRFPPEEKLVLSSQTRCSSRSVCLNRREAWATRRYEAHFLSKLSDCEGENSKTDSSVDFAQDCGYISGEQHEQLAAQCAEVGRMLGGMIRKPGSFLAAGHLTSDV